MGQLNLVAALVAALSLGLIFFCRPASAQLRRNYYANSCPNVENIVRDAVRAKLQQTNATVPATIRLFFHDCFVSGCDASVLVASTASNKAEKDHPDNLSLPADGFDTVFKAKAAVEATPGCERKVSCADILTMATRDVISLAGGPSYSVVLGRLDGLSSTAASVTGKLPQPTFNLNQLTAMFAARGLTQLEMIALSGAHTVGFSHCGTFSNRIYNFGRPGGVDPTINSSYVTQLKAMCPINADPTIAINMDPNTPQTFDNMYYKNLQAGKGLFTSDQVLVDGLRSRGIVRLWANNPAAFNQAFVEAMTKLGAVEVKVGRNGNGNIRQDCAVLG